jgi:phosphoglycolate phosphatase
MKYQAVLFDLDGTLLDTVPDLAVGTNAMLKELGLTEKPEYLIAQYVGKGAESLIHRALTGDMQVKAADALFQRALPIWKRSYQAVNGLHARFYPGVIAGLELFQRAQVQMAVVTNKPEEFTIPLLRKSGLDKFFSIIVAGDTCKRKKPDPMPLHHACSELGVSVEQVLFIGDSHNDAQAAKSAGIDCWLLPYGYNEGQAITDVPCQKYIQTIEQAALAVLEG